MFDCVQSLTYCEIEPYRRKGMGKHPHLLVLLPKSANTKHYFTFHTIPAFYNGLSLMNRFPQKSNRVSFLRENGGASQEWCFVCGVHKYDILPSRSLTCAPTGLTPHTHAHTRAPSQLEEEHLHIGTFEFVLLPTSLHLAIHPIILSYSKTSSSPSLSHPQLAGQLIVRNSVEKRGVSVTPTVCPPLANHHL